MEWFYMQVEKCIKEIENELELIDELIESHTQLIERVEASTPNRIEISALATVLHSFYNGIENIFKRVANRLDKKLPDSEFWHQELLDQMNTDTTERPAVISDEMYEKLNIYLGFRHFFRHAYAFQFKWERIKELILDIHDLYDRFKEEIEQFIESLPT